MSLKMENVNMSDNDNVVILPVITRLDKPVSRVIEEAESASLVRMLVIGEDEAGNFYFDSSCPDGPDVLWDLEMAKKLLLDTVE